jgi:hypothetical protein
MKMIDAYWVDLDGRKHRAFTVRSAGSGFFMILDTLRNCCPIINGDKFTNRADAWQYLTETDN